MKTVKAVEPAPAAAPGRKQASPVGDPAARRPSRHNREWLHGLLMSAPAVAGLIAFVGIPFCYAVVLSFYNVRLGSPLEPTFFGIEQYRRLLTDPDLSGPFLRALLNNLTFAVVVVPLQTGLALGLAILLNRKLKAIGLFRSLFFLPVVFPMALVAVIWRLILARSDQGMLNSVLEAVSLGNWGAFDWLGDGLTAMASIIVLSVWQGVGFQMVICSPASSRSRASATRPPGSTGPPPGSSSGTSRCPAYAARSSSSPCSPRCCPSGSSTRCTCWSRAAASTRTPRAR